MSYKVQKITSPLVLGEGPHWDERQQALFFVSIHEKTIHKYVPATGDHSKTTLAGRPGFIVPVEGTTDQFVVGVELKFQIVQWDGKDGSPTRVVKELGEVDQHEQKNRLNDGKCDPRGRLFAGTMGFENPPGNHPPEKGSLYRVDSSKGGKVERIVERVGISNGLAWDLKERAMYYTDSLDIKIRRYDYDVDTGEISNQTFIFDLRANNIDGFPDGTTIDTDGNLWVAVFSGSCVIKIDPRTGKLLEKIPIPALQVTSVTFGGPNYDILFVTTASMNIDGEQLPPSTMGFENPPGNHPPEKGSLYRVDSSKGGKVERIVERVGISNGLAWDLKERAMYYTDSLDIKIRRYDYDVDTGEISNQTFIFDLRANNIDGFPDGTTIDTDGNLWVAVFSGSCVIKIDPRTGKLLEKIPIPALQVTSVTFGGPNYDILFVTTASMNIDGEQLPPSGSTFMITGLGVKGLPNVNFKL